MFQLTSPFSSKVINTWHFVLINAFLPVGRVNPFEHEMYPGKGENPIPLTTKGHYF